MSKEMIWVPKGGRPSKNKPDMELLLKECESMSVKQLMEKYGVSQATMYRYIREAKGLTKPEARYDIDEQELTIEELRAQNAALKGQIKRLEEYFNKLNK